MPVIMSFQMSEAINRTPFEATFGCRARLGLRAFELPRSVAKALRTQGELEEVVARNRRGGSSTETQVARVAGVTRRQSRRRGGHRMCQIHRCRRRQHRVARRQSRRRGGHRACQSPQGPEPSLPPENLSPVGCRGERWFCGKETHLVCSLTSRLLTTPSYNMVS